MQHPSDDLGLLQEIEQDLQRQKFEALWKRVGPYVMGFAAGIVLLTSLIVGWNNYSASQKQSRTEALVTALDKDYDKPEEAAAALEKVATENAGSIQATYAKLQEAAGYVSLGTVDKGVEIYDAIAADSSVDPIYRSFARLLSVQSDFENKDIPMLEAKLAPLMNDEDAWRFLAYEYAGHLAVKSGDQTKARKLFQKLSTMKDIPEFIAQRTADMLTWLGEAKK